MDLRAERMCQLQRFVGDRESALEPTNYFSFSYSTKSSPIIKANKERERQLSSRSRWRRAQRVANIDFQKP